MLKRAFGTTTRLAAPSPDLAAFADPGSWPCASSGRSTTSRTTCPPPTQTIVSSRRAWSRSASMARLLGEELLEPAAYRENVKQVLAVKTEPRSRWPARARVGQSKLMRSLSITSGRWYTCVWMEPMYSPRMPMKKSCTLPKKYTPMTRGARPSSNVLQNVELDDQVDDSDQQREDRQQEAAHRGESQWHLGVVRDAEHGHVVQRVEVVLGDPAARRGCVYGISARS